MSVQDVASCHCSYSFSVFRRRKCLVYSISWQKDQCNCVEHATPTPTPNHPWLVCVFAYKYKQRSKLINLLKMSFMFRFHCDTDMICHTQIHKLTKSFSVVVVSFFSLSKMNTDTALRKKMYLCESESVHAMRCV